MPSLYRHNRFFLVAMAALLLAAGAAAVAINEGKQSSADASTIQPVTQRFGVFSQDALAVSPSTLSDKAQLWLESISQGARLATEASQAPMEPGTAAEGSSISSLAKVEGDNGVTLVAARGDEEICAFAETSEVGTCATDSLAEAGRAFSAAPAGCSAYHVVGIMPNGVSSLAVKTSGTDAVQVIPVRSNVYEATLSAEEAVLTSQNPSVELILPLGEYAEMNPAC